MRINSIGAFNYQLEHMLASIKATLEGREYSCWSPVIGGWALWYQHAND
jgi:hypothetical protein